MVAITGEDWTSKRASDVDRRYGSRLVDFMKTTIRTHEPAIHTMRLFQGDRELGPDEHPLQLATRTGRTASNFESQLLRPDGERRDVMVTATPLLDEAGKVRGGIAAVVDISERKHAEARQMIRALMFAKLRRRQPVIGGARIGIAQQSRQRRIPLAL